MEQVLPTAGSDGASFSSVIQSLESAATTLGVKPYSLLKPPHPIEVEMALDPDTLMDLVAKAPRLKQAVKGWVAEYHLEEILQGMQAREEIQGYSSIEQDGRPDFEVTHRGRTFTVEVKNVMSGNNYFRSKGEARAWKIDFQRTRNQLSGTEENGASGKSEGKSGRFYKVGEFDILATALHNQTQRWEYLFIDVEQLPRDSTCDGCIKKSVEVPLTPVGNWRSSLVEVMNEITRRRP